MHLPSLLLSALFVVLGFGAGRPQTSKFDHSHSAWTNVLRKHVRGDAFDYAALKKDRAELDSYLAALHAVQPADTQTWTREQQYAFWINVYNAHCISLVLSEYPVDGIKDIGGWFSPVWKKAFIEMPAFHPSGKAGKLSLDDVEHAILRPTYKDARVHAAVNCASVGCPPLRNEAFVADRLDAQLDEQCKNWLADARRNKIDWSKSKAELSAIFDWFKDDFVRDAGSVQNWIAKFSVGGEALAGAKLSISYLDYSWKLNDAPKK